MHNDRFLFRVKLSRLFRMSLPGFLWAMLLGVSAVTYAQEDNIYSAEAPEVFLIWHRVADYSPQLRSVEAAELSPDGTLAVSVSKFGYDLMVWRVADGALLWQAKSESEIECVTFSPDGKQFVTGGEDYFIRIYDLAEKKEVKAIEHDSGLDGITWSHDGKWIAAGSEKGDAWFWNTDDFSLKGKVNVGSTINSLQFTADDKQLMVGGNIQTPDPVSGKTIYTGFAKRIDMEKMEVVQEYGQGVHEASVKSTRISPDERLVATGSFDQVARIFDLSTGELLHEFKEPLRIEAVAFTPDGQYLVTGGHQKKISFYRLSDNKLVYELPCPRTEYLHFSADGRLMLTGHEDSGLLSLYMFLSDTQHRQGVYQRISNQQLNNRDLKDNQ